MLVFLFFQTTKMLDIFHNKSLTNSYCELKEKKLTEITFKLWRKKKFLELVSPPFYSCDRNPFPYKLCTNILKTLGEKEKFLVTSNSSFSHSVFYPFGELSAIFIIFEIVVCKLSIWKSLKFVIWERVKHFFSLRL